MFEAPDKRAWYFFLPILLLGAVDILAPLEGSAERAVGILLHVSMVVGGASIFLMSLSSGSFLLRPSTTWSDSPVLYFLEMAGIFAFTVVSVVMLFKFL